MSWRDIPDSKLRIEFDEEVNAAYVRVHDGVVARTRSIMDSVNIDLDEYGVLLGVEVLGRTQYPLASSRTSVDLAQEHVENGHHGEHQPYCYRCQYFELRDAMDLKESWYKTLHAWWTYLSSFGKRFDPIPNPRGQRDRDNNHQNCKECTP